MRPYAGVHGGDHGEVVRVFVVQRAQDLHVIRTCKHNTQRQVVGFREPGGGGGLTSGPSSPAQTSNKDRCHL